MSKKGQGWAWARACMGLFVERARYAHHVDLSLKVDVVAAKRIGERDGGLLEAEADEDDDEKARDRHHRLELDHRVRDEQEVEREHEGQRVVVREGDRLRHRVDDVRAVPAQRQRLLLEGVEVRRGPLLLILTQVVRQRAQRPDL